VQGPVMRRGGSRYVGQVKTGRGWLVPFQFSQEQSYILEFGGFYLRFWVNRGQLLSGGVPYEIVTPWGEADLLTTEGTLALRVVQSGDVMWICHYTGLFPPYELKRLGATNWTLTQVAFDKGPFQDLDPDNPTTLTAFAETGLGVTLQASGLSVFTAEDVGTSIYLEQEDSEGIKAWTARAAVALNDIRRWEGNFYQCTAVGTGVTATGDNPPIHTEGRAWDGNLTRVPNDDFDDLGAEWEYLHSGWGVARIVGFTDGQHVTIDILKRLPQNVTFGFKATKRWAFSAFSARPERGWPTNVQFFRERLCYAMNRQLFMSVVGDFEDFSDKEGPDVTAETAVTLKLTSDRLDTIRWIIESSTLLIGTSRNEMSVQEQTTAKVFAADNATKVDQTDYGSRLLKPLRVAGAVLFVQRAGRKLREMIYDFSQDRYKADDLTVLSEHVLDSGIIDMDYQQEPDTIVWCALANGALGALTYNRERGVIAWVPHILGGITHTVVESVATISSPDGRRDDVWLEVRRQINGVTVRYIEYIEDNRLAEDHQADAFYGDCGITYDGLPSDTIVGLDHLEGAQVQVLADGVPHPDVVVSGGTIHLQQAASKVHVGFDSAAKLQTMRLEGGANDGSAQTRRKSISELWIRVKDTLGGLVGPSFDRLDPLPYLDPTSSVGTVSPLFTGDTKIEFPGEWDEEGYVCVQSSPMLPMTLVALVGRVEIND
jgi:hypothetical protein